MKSDDTVGRTRMYEKIVKGDNILEPGLPESFNVLIKELQSLGLDVEMFEENEDGTRADVDLDFGPRPELNPSDIIRSGELEDILSYFQKPKDPLGFNCGADRLGIPGEDSQVVLRRGEEAGRRSIIVRSSRNGMVCSVQKYLGRPRITSAIAASTSA